MRIYLSITSSADKDVDDCFDYIAHDNLDAAQRFYHSAYATFQVLCENPFIGKNCDFGPAELQHLRMWFVEGFDKYLIFYRVNGNTLEIIRVLHSARDIERNLIDDDLNY